MEINKNRIQTDRKKIKPKDSSLKRLTKLTNL